MKKRLWHWLERNIPSLLVFYYTVVGRTDSLQMKHIHGLIEKKKRSNIVVSSDKTSMSLDINKVVNSDNIAIRLDINKFNIFFGGKPIEETTTRTIQRNNDIYKPAVEIFIDEKCTVKLKYQLDYTLEYYNNTSDHPGTAICIITGQGKYTGTIVKTFEKIPLKISAPDYSESQKASQHIQPHVLVNISLINNDVISFDVFDTLILRPFARPQDLFLLLGQKHNLPIFSKIRQESEKKIRDLKMQHYGHRECCIEEIYEEIERITGIPAAVGVRAELDLELELIQPNPYMLRLFNLLKRYKHVRIVFISNMYWHNSQIDRLLVKCGYNGYEKIYVSCDYNLNKKDGALFNFVKSQLGDTLKYVHIGDNQITDVEGCQMAGMEARRYFCPNELGKNVRTKDLTNLVGSAYIGVVNNYLLNNITIKSKWFETGFIYGSLYIMGYMSYIHKKVNEKGIDKVLFLARDGAIYKKIYDLMYPDSNNEYVYYSRIQNIFNVTLNNFEFLNYRLFRQLAQRKVRKTLAEILQFLYLEELVPQLHLHGLFDFEQLTENNLSVFQNFVITNKNTVLKVFKMQAEKFGRYFEKVLGTSKRFAIVDVGWEGSSPNMLTKLIEDRGCYAETFLAGDMFFRYPDGNLFKTNVNGYVFSRGHNDYYAEDMKANLINYSCEIFESLTQDIIPSFRNIDVSEDGCMLFKFCFPDIENKDKVTEIHDGIVAFVKEYLRIFKNYPCMLDVPASDVYKVIKTLLNNPKRSKEFLFNFDPFSYSNNYRSII